MANYYTRTKKISLACILFFIYIVTLPLTIAKVGSSSIYRFITLATIMAFAFDYLIEKNHFHISKKKILPFTFFLFYTTISAVWAIRLDLAINIIVGLFLIYLVYLFATSYIFTTKEIQIIYYAWIVASVIVICLTIFNGVESGYQRYTATLMGGTEDKNQIPGYYFMPLVLLLDKAQKKKKYYIVLGLALAGMLYSVMLAGSRGGLLSLVFTIVMYYFLGFNIGKRNKMTQKIISISLIITIFAFILYFILPFISVTSVNRFALKAIMEDGGSGRLSNWKKLLDIYSSSPLRMLFGFGPNGTCEYLEVGYAHNQIIQILFDGGIVGLLIFSWFIISSFKYSYKNNRLAFIAFLGMSLLSMTITAYTAYKVYWNIIMMMQIMKFQICYKEGRVRSKT